MAAFIDHLDTLEFSPSLPIAYPGITFPAAGAVKPENYLTATYLPNVTRTVTIGGGTQQHRGIFQVSVFWKSGVGLVKPLDIAGQIIGHFPKDLLLYSGAVRVKIDRKPWASSPIQEDDRVQIPVSIPFHCFA